jgi:hypothetical protein
MSVALYSIFLYYLCTIYGCCKKPICDASGEDDARGGEVRNFLKLGLGRARDATPATKAPPEHMHPTTITAAASPYRSLHDASRLLSSPINTRLDYHQPSDAANTCFPTH